MLDKNIIFLLSLPRSGSTLLQRMLASHSKISTCSEPWVLLPFVYAFKPYGTFTEYSHTLSYRALQDFIGNMPKKEDDYYQALGRFTKSLYERVMPRGTDYFLDKTPRYFLILSEIAKIFPDAKFIFLFRNPLYVLASIIKTWLKGRLRIENHYIDLFLGPPLLAEGYRKLKNKAISVKYEDLLKAPSEEMRKILAYLELDYEESILRDFSEVKLKGKMGDPSGTNEYTSIDLRPMEKWKNVMNTKFRKKFALKYLSRIGTDTIETFGYSVDEVKRELTLIEETSSLGIKDRLDLLKGYFFRILDITMLKLKFKQRKTLKKDFMLYR